MENPFRSEAEAYRFLLLSVGYFAAIVAAAAIHRWLGLAVFVVLTVASAAWYLRRRGEPRPRSSFPPHGAENERRILVIANETVGGEALRALIHERTEDVKEQVLVVTPALNSRLRHLASDDGEARAAAQARLRASLERLHEIGIDARGEVGDAEPLQAIEDACRAFQPDEIVISTHPPGRSHWLEQRLVERAQERFDVPIRHVVVDLEREREHA